MSDSDILLCHTVHGQLVPVPRSALVFRPTVYGIAIHDDQVLLLPNRLNGRWELPGGGVEPGEQLSDALRREFREETALNVRPGELLHFEERFFQWLEQDVPPWHVLVFYYRVKVVGGTLRAVPYQKDPSDEPSGVPQWMVINDLSLDELPVGYEVVMKAR